MATPSPAGLPHSHSASAEPAPQWLPWISPETIRATGVIVFAVLALLRICTQQPWNDEAYHATPALNLLREGHMGTSNVEEHYLYFQGINSHTYWNVPFYYLIGAAWHGILGFDLIRARLLSMVLAFVGLLALGYVAGKLAGNRWVMALTVIVTGTNFAFVRSASESRLESATLAFGMLAIASWLHWRERKLARAVVLSHILVVLSGLCHPMGILYWCALVTLTLGFDRNRLTFRLVLGAAVPYLIGGVAWGMYILQAPNDFMVQFFGNVRYHQGASMFSDPLGALAEEARVRYLSYFGLGNRLTHPLKQLRALQMLAYLAAIGIVLGVPRIRRTPGARPAVGVLGVVMLTLAVVDGGRAGTYIVHVLPWASAVLILALLGLAQDSRPRAVLGAAVLAFLITLQVAGILFIARSRTLQTHYYPATDYLLKHVPRDATIFGSSELGFVIGFERPLIDDSSLGFTSGRKADFIVVDENWRSTFGMSDGTIGKGYSRRVLDPCSLVFRNGGYHIFRCPRTAEHSETAGHAF